MEQIADAYGLTTDEPAQHVDRSSTAARIAQDWWVSGGRESTLLYTFDREEILTLLEANGVQTRADLSGSRAIPSVLDLYHDVSQAQDYLRRVLAGETLETISEVGGRVFETHLVPVRDQHQEITSILCIAIDVTEGALIRDLSMQKRAEAVLRKHEIPPQALLDALPDRLFQLNHEGILLSYHAPATDPLHLPPSSLGTSITKLLPPLVAQQILNAMQQARETRSVQVCEYRLRVGETERVQEARVVATEHDGCVCLVRNITEHKQMEQALRTSEERYRTVVSNAPIVLFALDASGVITLSEGRGLQAMGLTPGQLVGRSAFETYRDFPQILDALHRVLAGETLTAILPLGDLVFETQFTPLRASEGRFVGVIGVATDISERVQAEEALRHQTLHDPLTDLPNRTLLLARMEEALLTAEQVGGGMALLLLDLARFKEVNNTFGHQYGDQFLQQVGVRLRQAVSAAATVARLGGDEFAVLLPSADEGSARQVASALHTALQAPFLVEDVPLQVEISIGAALSPAHGTDPRTLLRHADVALDSAKRGHEKFALYDARHDQYHPHRLALLGALGQAIATHELHLYYQPKAELKTGLVGSVEALLRWQHPTQGCMPPDQFLPVAEQTELIMPLTRWVVETAVEQCRNWLDSGLELGIAVNLSVRNLCDTTLPDTIAGLLAQYRVPPHLLCVEITESAVMGDAERSLHVLNRLFALGVRIAIDDFGTGYSSLSYLKRLPADELKIDRTFVQQMTTNQADEAIVRATLTMAHSLGLHVVAEGVEDQETWNRLATLGCDTVQGYYLSRPLPARELEHWLEDRQEKQVHPSHCSSAETASAAPPEKVTRGGWSA